MITFDRWITNPIKIEKNTLYTPIFKYRRGRTGKSDCQITAVGTVHFGPEEYYRTIQSYIGGIPNGYHEGVKPPEKWQKIPIYKRPFVHALGKGMDKMVKSVADSLGYVMEEDMLAPPDSWKNADMDLAEMAENLPMTDIIRAYTHMKKLGLYRLANYFSPQKYIDRIKNEYWEVFFENKGPELTPGEANAILLDRNNMLFEDMKPGLDRDEYDELGILYGADHIPGIHHWLYGQGFSAERNSPIWVPAWRDFDPPKRVKSSMVSG
jgi:hypothetical protein